MSNLANRTIAYYLHPDDSSKKLDGTAADLTGADGDVMVEIPITYWRIDHYTDANNHAHTVWLVSNQAFTNSAPHPFFYVSPGGATLRTQYVGAFHSVICDSDGAPLTTSLEASASAAYVAGRKARSVIGAKPFTSMTQATHRTAAANNGGYGINSLFKQFLLLMMAIEGGSFDTQTTISEGFLFAKEWDYRYTRLSGRTVSMGNRTGSVFYDATAGVIELDGKDIREYTFSQLYEKIGYISQKAILFSGTAEENLTFGDAGHPVTEDDAMAALDIAQAKDFVENLPGGLHAGIAQGGTNLSGGQKQRLTIARAIARKPEILIFDDSFSALDYRTDAALRKRLASDLKGTTCLIVAQRIGTIKKADRIVVLDEGKAVGIGTHEELMRDCEVYREIALSQLSQTELEAN